MPGKPPKVLLLTPPYGDMKYRTDESLGIKYLAAALLQHGIETRAIDAPVTGRSAADILQVAAAWQTSFIGVSVQFIDVLDHSLEFASQLKASLPGAHLCLGGNVPSALWDRILPAYPFIDTIVIGEGERTLPELLDHLHQPQDWHAIPGLAYRDGPSCRATPPRPPITDLDTLPFPRRDDPAEFLGARHYTMVSSRGCPYNCAFCNIPAITTSPGQPRWRGRSPANVVDELQQLVETRRAAAFSFADDNFLGSSPTGLARAVAIAGEIVRRGLKFTWACDCRASDISRELFMELKQAGLQRVFMGAESGLDRTLAHFHKDLTTRQVESAVNTMRELDLEVNGYFVPFHPDVTLDELRQTYAFMDRLDLALPTAIPNRLMVDYDTPSRRRLQQEGRLFPYGWRFGYLFNDWRIEALCRLLSAALGPLTEADYLLTSQGIPFRQVQALLSRKGMAIIANAFTAVETLHPPTPLEVRDLGIQLYDETTAWLLEMTASPTTPPD